MRTNVAVLAGMAFALATGAGLAADRPRLTLNTRGSASSVMGLSFTADSSRLLVGGEDKVVHVWVLRDAGAAPPRATISRTLRWEFARGLRGAVFSMAVSSRDDEVAIGGYAARDVGGTVVVLDAGDGAIERSLPNWDGKAFVGTGHRSSIVSLDYSPNGNRLLSVAKSGEVLLWTGPNWQATRIREAAGPQETFQPALFLDDDRFVVAEPTPGRNDWRLATYRIGANGPIRDEVLASGHTGHITALARQPDSARWVSSDENGRIVVWTAAGRPVPRVLSARGRMPLDLSLGPQGVLAVACGRDTRGDAVLELWDGPSRKRLDTLRTSVRRSCRATAISPDGRWVATHSPDSHAVFVYPLRRNGQLVEKPFSGRPAILRGRGRAVWKVAFAADGGRRVGLSRVRKANPGPNDDGELDSVFDLDRWDFAEGLPENVQWRSPTDNAGGWRAAIVAEGSRVDLRRGAERAVIELDRRQQGLATCFCFVPDERGRPIGIAIGTAEQHGIYLYALPGGGLGRAGNQPTLVRYFRDHNGPVRSLSVSRDGRLLVSGAEDQLIKIWSLSGLGQRSETFPPAAAWGASFRVANGGLNVENTNPAGIVVGRGLANGDIVDFVRTAKGEEREPARMLASLASLPLFQSALLTARRGGRALDPIVVVPGWEPILTIFVDDRGEWAAFTPTGEYDSSVAEGNELFGWQLNRGPNVTPRLFAAAELQQEFEKPDVIRRLLGGVIPPPADRTRLANVMGTVPELRLLEPRSGTVAANGRPVRVVAELRFTDPQQKAGYVVRGFVNGIPLGEPKIVDDGLVQRVEWTANAPDPISVFRVFAEDRDGGPDALMKQDQVAIRAEAEPPRFRLNVLAMAVNDYAKGSKNFGPLKFAVGDATDFVERLRSHHEGKRAFYDLDEVGTMFDGEVTRGNVETRIESMRRVGGLAEDDLLVVFVSGHGYAIGSDYYFVPRGIDSVEQDDLERTAIPWHVLRRLADLPCRKVILLDTCYAGNVGLALDDQAPTERAVVKAATQPFKRYGFLVVMATDTDQSAREGVDFGNHGAFTNALLQGLDGKADGRAGSGADGTVSLFELAEFTRSQVARDTYDAQQPVFMPLDRFRSADPLRLVRTPGAGQPVAP